MGQLETDQDNLKKQLEEGTLEGLTDRMSGWWMLAHMRNYSAQKKPKGYQTEFLPTYVGRALSACGDPTHRRRIHLARNFYNHGGCAMYLEQNVNCWVAEYSTDNEAHDFVVTKTV